MRTERNDAGELEHGDARASSNDRPEDGARSRRQDGAWSRRRWLRAAGAGAVLAGSGFAGCLGDQDEAQSPTPSPSPTTTADPWTEQLDADREFWIVMADVAERDSFFPSTIVVQQGESVGIHLRNTGDEVHDFEIPAFDVAAEDVEPGATLTRTFDASEAGVHEIECELHPEWMYGQLVVLPEDGAVPTVDDRRFRIVMADVAERDSFFPSTNVAVEGEEVTMTVRNTGDELHDFEIPAFDVAEEEVEPDAEFELSFTADRPGIHEMECELHPEWMYGQFVVLPADGDYSRVEASDDRTLRVVMADVAERDSFFPETNVVKAGEEVSLRLWNTGDEVHDLDVEAFGIEVELDPDEQTTLSFTADQPGLHRMICELHPPEMNGQLWVVP